MIEIRTLGRTAVAVDGVELSGEAAWPRSLALLVYLGREPGPDRRDDVLGVLWPDREEKRARHALNQLLYTLRKASPQLDLESVKDRIDFATEVQLDVDEFERRLEADDLEGALELYEGPFLSDLAVDVADFQHWADRQRALLGRKFRKAALELMKRAKASGDYEHALSYARRLVRVDPLDDEAEHALIECLYLSGDRTAALRQYETYRDLLARELEVEPLAHTVELVERIRGEAGAPETGRAAPGQRADETVDRAVEAGTGGKASPAPGVESAETKPAREATPSRADDAHRAGEVGMSRRAVSHSARIGMLATVGLLGAAIGAALTLWLSPGPPGGSSDAAAALLPGFSSMPVHVATLPFQATETQASGDPEAGLRLSQLLARNLDGLGPFRTVDASTVRQAWTAARQEVAGAPSTERLVDLGRRLGADAVLVGTIRTSQAELSVTVDLVSVETGEPVASGDARGAPDDLPALADRLILDLMRNAGSVHR